MFIPDVPIIPPVPPPTMPVVPVFVPPMPGSVQSPMAWGSNVKFVTCVSCGHHFAYRMSRVVPAGTRERAEARLRKELQLDCDPIPCPSCGDYQPDMIRLLKRRYRPRLRVFGAVLLAAGIIACSAAFGFGFTWWPLIAALPAVGLGLILLRLGFARRLDPNAPSGKETRQAAGKQAEVVVPLGGGQGTAFVVAPDGKVADVRFMDVQSLPGQ